MNRFDVASYWNELFWTYLKNNPGQRLYWNIPTSTEIVCPACGMFDLRYRNVWEYLELQYPDIPKPDTKMVKLAAREMWQESNYVAHKIIPRGLDVVGNYFILCPLCHADAPDVNYIADFLLWVDDRKHVVIRRLWKTVYNVKLSPGENQPTFMWREVMGGLQSV